MSKCLKCGREMEADRPGSDYCLTCLRKVKGEVIHKIKEILVNAPGRYSPVSIYDDHSGITNLRSIGCGCCSTGLDSILSEKGLPYLIELDEVLTMDDARNIQKAHFRALAHSLGYEIMELEISYRRLADGCFLIYTNCSQTLSVEEDEHSVRSFIRNFIKDIEPKPGVWKTSGPGGCRSSKKIDMDLIDIRDMKIGHRYSAYDIRKIADNSVDLAICSVRKQTFTVKVGNPANMVIRFSYDGVIDGQEHWTVAKIEEVGA